MKNYLEADLIVALIEFILIKKGVNLFPKLSIQNVPYTF